MDVAKLVLDYLKALVWPIIVVIVMVFFRDEFRKLLRRLKSAKGAGAAVEFSEEVQAVAEEARQVVEAEVRETAEKIQELRSVLQAQTQEAREAAEAPVAAEGPASRDTRVGEPAEPSAADPTAAERSARAEQMARLGISLLSSTQAEVEQLLQSVLRPPAAPMDPLRRMAREHPEAAIMAAYREVEIQLDSLVRDVVRRSGAEGQAVIRPRVTSRQVQFLVSAGLPTEVAEVVMGLSRLRNEVTHGGRVDSGAATDYVSACAAALTLLTLYRRRLLPPDA